MLASTGTPSPKNDQSRVILDIGHVQGESGEVRKAEVRMTDDTHFAGFLTTYPKYVKTYDPNGQVSMYFWGEVSKKPRAVGAFTDTGVQPQRNVVYRKGSRTFSGVLDQ